MQLPIPEQALSGDICEKGNGMLGTIKNHETSSPFELLPTFKGSFLCINKVTK
jgi:hypothetical protein